jgi:hypothetical protein
MESEEYIEDDDNNSGDEMNVEFGVHRDVTMVPEAINLNVQAAEEFIRENRWLEEMMEEERVTKEQVEEEIILCEHTQQGLESDMIGGGKEDRREEGTHLSQQYRADVRDTIELHHEIIYQPDKSSHRNNIKKRKREYKRMIRNKNE